ncbi:MAG: hypothetical protein J6A54_03725 [Clostridia bacterium]|nr:hypothetical protein [Clostridia bacterium]
MSSVKATFIFSLTFSVKVCLKKEINLTSHIIPTIKAITAVNTKIKPLNLAFHALAGSLKNSVKKSGIVAQTTFTIKNTTVKSFSFSLFGTNLSSPHLKHIKEVASKSL